MDRSVHARKLRLDASRRIIAISDIHGNDALLKRLLQKVDYQPQNDVLLLLGDLIEKGPHNLQTLQTIRQLCAKGNAHALMGNCDFVCKNIVHRYNLDFLKKVLCTRKASLLHEMAARIHQTIDADTDMEQLCDALMAGFSDELRWVDALPQIIHTDRYIFAHAGIKEEEHFGDDFREVLTYPHFLLHAPAFTRYVIVGHMPVSEYCHAIACFHPIIDERKHIISIDGANMIKKAGQLNALLIEDDRFSYESVDDLPLVRVRCDVVPRNQDPLFITWRESEVRILTRGTQRDECLHLSSGKRLWIDHAFLHERDGHWQADDFTTYQMPLQRGELVSLVSCYDRFALIKKAGILGWAHRAHLCL